MYVLSKGKGDEFMKKDPILIGVMKQIIRIEKMGENG